jgi:hypothetical protein
LSLAPYVLVQTDLQNANHTELGVISALVMTWVILPGQYFILCNFLFFNKNKYYFCLCTSLAHHLQSINQKFKNGLVEISEFRQTINLTVNKLKTTFKYTGELYENSKQIKHPQQEAGRFHHDH